MLKEKKTKAERITNTLNSHTYLKGKTEIEINKVNRDRHYNVKFYIKFLKGLEKIAENLAWQDFI